MAAKIASLLSRRLPIDRRRIYATGFSNGASLTFRLARELPRTFAAIAPVAGVDWMFDQPLPERVPMLHILGTADPLNPVDGGKIFIGRRYYGTKPSLEEMLTHWIQSHGDSADQAWMQDGEGVRHKTRAGPDGRTMLQIRLLDGHGHHWPGGSSLLPTALAGANSTTFNATDASRRTRTAGISRVASWS